MSFAIPVTKHHAFKSCGGRGYEAPHILYLGCSGGEWSASSFGRYSGYPLGGRRARLDTVMVMEPRPSSHRHYGTAHPCGWSLVRFDLNQDSLGSGTVLHWVKSL
jgi:hypothetical protein